MKIYTEITNKEIEEVLAKTLVLEFKERLKALWSVFKDLQGDREFELNVKRKVKFFGIKFSFDIRNVIYGEVEEYFDSNNVKIRGCVKIKLQDYWDELEARESIMKEAIRSLYDEGEQGELQNEEHD